MVFVAFSPLPASYFESYMSILSLGTKKKNTETILIFLGAVVERRCQLSRFRAYAKCSHLESALGTVFYEI